MAERFEDSYYGRLAYEGEKVEVNGNRATVSGTDSKGHSYKNHFKRTRNGWRFNGYSGASDSRVTNTKPKYKNNKNTTRPDSKEQQKMRMGNRGK